MKTHFMNSLFIKHIGSVAQYESKILLRSWFFRIFSVLAIVVTIILNFSLLLNGDGQPWIYKSIPANIPYLNMVLYNTAQAIIAIFLSSEFLKRDKQLDTSEVFYVRPLSNTEYVIGKIWGNIRVFLVLNLIVLTIALIINILSPETEVDIQAYILYFLLVSLPTLIFIIGLSTFLMLILKNQALTFVTLLGYIGLSLFYIQDKYYYLFDYINLNFPLFKSTMIGFDNLSIILRQRAIYLFLGLACVFFTIQLFHRLPNNRKEERPWLAIGLIMSIMAIIASYYHISSHASQEKQRIVYTTINNQYIQTPKMIIDEYRIKLEQHPDKISSEVLMKGKALQTSDKFTFCLNPGLIIKEIKCGERKLDYERDQQIIIVNTGKEITAGSSLELEIWYEGRIKEDFCFLDIDAKTKSKPYEKERIKINKRYSFQTKDYLLFTPECYWYPRPGTAYSNVSSDWQQTYFSHFKTDIKTLPGLTWITQSENIPLQAISLIIGRYKRIQTHNNGIQYNLWYYEDNDFYSNIFEEIKDTIPGMLNDKKEELEREYKLDYPFNRFSIVEVPAQFYTYLHSWSKTQEVMQPEMVLLPEKGCFIYQCDFLKEINKQKRFSKRRGAEMNEYEAKVNALNSFLGMLLDQQDGRIYEKVRGNTIIGHRINPYFVFPQIFNFRYNFYSTEWSITNRLLEVYLQNKTEAPEWVRATNGIGYFEKANLLMKEKGLKDLLNENDNGQSIEFIICQNAIDLFSPAETKMGISTFKDSLYTVLRRNSFKNIQFETLLDTLENISGVELKANIKKWEHPRRLPYFKIQRPHISQVKVKGKEYFVLEQIISNDSDYDGFVQIDLEDRKDQWSDERSHRKIGIKAHQTQKIVSIWDEYVRWINVNTLLSENLPNIVGQSPIDNGKIRTSFYTTDSCYILPQNEKMNQNEIIIDNENTPLFSVSQPFHIGLLPKWIDQYIDNKIYEFKYKAATHWNPPFQWTLTTGNDYYGAYIHSAYVIRSGDGNQYAKWTVPIPEKGEYDIYYYVVKGGEYRNARDKKVYYNFTITYDGFEEDNYINMNRAENGWKKIGSYHIEGDTIEIKLTNKCEVSWVVADAIKLIKQ